MTLLPSPGSGQLQGDPWRKMVQLGLEQRRKESEWARIPCWTGSLAGSEGVATLLSQGTFLTASETSVLERVVCNDLKTGKAFSV